MNDVRAFVWLTVPAGLWIATAGWVLLNMGLWPF